MALTRVATLVLKFDGRLHLAREDMSVADAARWAAEGFHVFRLAVDARGRWAMNHVNTGKLVTDNAIAPDGDESPFLQPLLLTLKARS